MLRPSQTLVNSSLLAGLCRGTSAAGADRVLRCMARVADDRFLSVGLDTGTRLYPSGGSGRLHGGLREARRTGGLGVPSGDTGGVLVDWREIDLQGLPEQESPGADAQRLRPAQKPVGDENSDVLVGCRPVGRQVLSLQICVDRHLRPAPSAYRRYEVDGCRAAPSPDQLQRLLGYLDVHTHSPCSGVDSLTAP